MASRQQYLDLAAGFEAQGNAEAAALYRRLAGEAAQSVAQAPPPAPVAAPAPVAPPAPVEEFTPPPGEPLAQESPYIGMTTQQITAAKRAEQAEPTPWEDYGPPYDPSAITPASTGMTVEPMPEQEKILPSLGTEFMPPAPGFEEAPGVYGRPVDEPSEAMRLRDDLVKLQEQRIVEYTRQGIDLDAAEQMALDDIKDILRTRVVGPEGELTTRGEGSVGTFLESYLPIPLPPFFRESRVDFQTVPPTFEDPETGERRPATRQEMSDEAFARQKVLTPEMAARARQTRAMERELAYQQIPYRMLLSDEYDAQVRKEIADRTDSYFTDVLSSVDPRTGVGIETPLGALVRSTGLISTLVNEAALGLPLYYDVDEQGNPTNPDQFAFKVNDFLVRSAERMGYSSEEAKDIFSGVVGGKDFPTGIPVPFQGMNRGGATVLDPVGMRGASETETYLGDVYVSLAKGRFLGDELYSMPSYVQDLAEAAFINNDETMGTGQRLQDIDETMMGNSALYYPMIVGAGLEMIYGIGPISAAGKAARVTGKGAKAASLSAATKLAGMAGAAAYAGDETKYIRLMGAAQGLEDVAKGAQFVAHPVETSKRIRLIRAAQDLLDDQTDSKPVFDVLMDRAEVKTVLAEKISKDVLTPYLIAAKARTKGVTVGELRALAGDSSSGQTFLRRIGVNLGHSDERALDTITRDPQKLEKALLEYKYSVHKPEIDAILKRKGTDSDKAARIFDLLAGTGVDSMSRLTTEQRRAAERLWGIEIPGVLRPLQEAAAGNGTIEVALDAMDVQPNKVYLPISKDAPVMQMLHDFGGQLYSETGAPFRLGTERPLQGPAAESFERRLGMGMQEEPLEVLPERVFNAFNTRPDEVREAAIGAGGRLVENSLENLIPEDLVFVTDKLMVPRQKITPELMRDVAANARFLERVEIQIGPKVNGKPTLVYKYPDLPPDGLAEVLELLGGSEAVRRSPVKTAIYKKMKAGVPLTQSEHHFFEDEVLTFAYRSAFGDAAKEALLAGPQTQQARVPTVGLGGITSLEARLTGLEEAPRQARGLAEAREPSFLSVVPQTWAVTSNVLGSAVRKASKDYYKKYKTKLPYQTPYAAELTDTRIREAVAAIPDNFQREVRDAAMGSDNPERSFEQIIQRRVNREVQQAKDAAIRRVDEMTASGMTEAEAYTQLAYQQRAGQAGAEALGERIGKAGGALADAKQVVENYATVGVYEHAWQNILRSFFGQKIYDSTLAPANQTNALYPYILKSAAADPSLPSSYREVTPKQLREVIALIRKDNPNLVDRGLARARVPGGILASGLLTKLGGTPQRSIGTKDKEVLRLVDDAIVDTLSGWAMGQDRKIITQQEVSRMMDENPYLRVDLMPSPSTANSYRRVQDASALTGARMNIAGRLGALAMDATDPDAADAQVLTRMMGGPGGTRQAFTGVTSGGAPVDPRLLRPHRMPGTNFTQPVDPTTGKVGRFTQRLDNLTARHARNLNPSARRALVDFVYSKMLEQGRGTPDLRTLLNEGLDDPQLDMLFFEKNATTKALELLLSEMTLQFERSVRRNGPDTLEEALAQAFPSADDRALYQMILSARRGKMKDGKPVRDQNIVVSMRRGLVENEVEKFIAPIIDEMQANARAHGWTPDLTASRESLVVMADKINPNDPRFAMMGQDYIDALSNLKAASKDGKLAENLEALQKSDKIQRWATGESSAYEYVMQVLGEAVTIPRTTAAAGLLAGGYYFDMTEDGVPYAMPLPNTRYIGTNFITAPLIAATTLGATGAIRMLPGTTGVVGQAGQVARQAGAQAGVTIPKAKEAVESLPDFLRKPLVDTLTPGPANEVLFTATNGKRWTRLELQEAMDAHNINISRGGVEFANSFARDLLRDTRLTADGVKSPALRQYLLRNLDPTRTGFWQYFANATDRAFRQNTFASALKAGYTPQQAAQLARNVVLDYGNVKYTSGLNKYAMFLAFRESMTREMIEAMSRDPDTINRTLLLHRDLQKQMDDELGADHSKFRLPIGGTKMFDQTAGARNWGPINPGLDMYGDLVRFAAMGLQAGASDIPAGSMAQAIADESLSPIYNFLFADALARPSFSGKGQKVDDIWVAYAIENGPTTIWPWMKERYNIIPVTRQVERRAGRLEAADPQVPSLGRTEYRFESPADHARFIRDMALLQVLGFERTMADYTKQGLTYGVEDYIDPKRRGLPTTFGFATGLETPIGMGSQMNAVQRAIRQQQKAVQAQTPRE